MPEEEDIDKQLELFWKSSFLGGGVKSLASIADTAGALAGDPETEENWLWKFLIRGLNPPDQRTATRYREQAFDMLKDMGLPENLLTRFKSIITIDPDAFPPLASIGQLIILWIISQQKITNLTNAVSKIEQRAFNREIQSDLADMAAQVTAAIRSGDPTANNESLNELGLSDDEIGKVTLANQGWLGAAEISELFRRGTFNVETATEALRKAGFLESDHPKQILELAQPLIDRGTVAELARRGLLKGAELDKHLKQLGFTPERIEKVKSIIPVLPGGPSILQAFHRGHIEESEARERLGREGLVKGDANLVMKGSFTPVGVGDTIDAFHRGVFDEKRAVIELVRNGIDPQAAPIVLNLGWRLPGPQDVITFSVRDIFNPEIVKEFGLDQDFPPEFEIEGRKVGFQRPVLEQFWKAHWKLPSAQQGFDLFHRGIIEKPALENLLVALDFPPGWRDKMIQLSDRLIPRRTIPRLLRNEVITDAGALDLFDKLGFGGATGVILTKDAVLAAVQPEREATQAQAERAFIDGTIDGAAYIEHLKTLNYSEEAIEFFKARATLKKEQFDKKEKAREEKEEADSARTLTKAEVIRSFKAGTLRKEEAEKSLEEMGYTKETIGFLIEFAELQDKRKAMLDQAAAIKKLYFAHLIEDNKVTAQLAQVGFSQPEADQQFRVWRLELKTQDKLDAVRDRLPTKADIDDWLKKSIIGVGEWVGYYEQLGFGNTEIRHYLEELIQTIEGS